MHKEIVVGNFFYGNDDEYSTLTINGEEIYGDTLINGLLALSPDKLIGYGKISYPEQHTSHIRGAENIFDIYLLEEEVPTTGWNCPYKLTVFCCGKFIYKIRRYSSSYGPDLDWSWFFIPLAKKICKEFDIKARFFYEYEKTMKVRSEV